MGKIRASDLRHPLRAALRDQREQARKNATASRFALSGLSVTGEGETTVDGNLVVTGDFTAQGKISNDALTNPVIPQVLNLSQTTFAVGVPFAEIVGADVTVPAGFTQLLVSASEWLQLYNAKTTGGNNGTGGDYIYAQVVIGGTSGQFTATGVSGNGGTATATSGLAQLITGLTPGGTVRVSAYGATDFSVASSVSNKCLLIATLSWLR